MAQEDQELMFQTISGSQGYYFSDETEVQGYKIKKSCGNRTFQK